MHPNSVSPQESSAQGSSAQGSSVPLCVERSPQLKALQLASRQRINSGWSASNVSEEALSPSPRNAARNKTLVVTGMRTIQTISDAMVRKQVFSDRPPQRRDCDGCRICIDAWENPYEQNEYVMQAENLNTRQSAEIADGIPPENDQFVDYWIAFSWTAPGSRFRLSVPHGAKTRFCFRP